MMILENTAAQLAGIHEHSVVNSSLSETILGIKQVTSNTIIVKVPLYEGLRLQSMYKQFQHKISKLKHKHKTQQSSGSHLAFRKAKNKMWKKFKNDGCKLSPSGNLIRENLKELLVEHPDLGIALWSLNHEDLTHVCSDTNLYFINLMFDDMDVIKPEKTKPQKVLEMTETGPQLLIMQDPSTGKTTAKSDKSVPRNQGRSGAVLEMTKNGPQLLVTQDPSVKMTKGKHQSDSKDKRRNAFVHRDSRTSARHPSHTRSKPVSKQETRGSQLNAPPEAKELPETHSEDTKRDGSAHNSAKHVNEGTTEKPQSSSPAENELVHSSRKSVPHTHGPFGRTHKLSLDAKEQTQFFPKPSQLHQVHGPFARHHNPMAPQIRERSNVPNHMILLAASPNQRRRLKKIHRAGSHIVQVLDKVLRTNKTKSSPFATGRHVSHGIPAVEHGGALVTVWGSEFETDGKEDSKHRARRDTAAGKIDM